MELKYEIWEYCLIPFIAGFVGYFTNVLALHMTFYPLEFVGIELFRLKNEPWGLFGWQGIIPTRAEKMAKICFDLMTTKLFHIKEIFGRIDPEQFADSMEDSILLLIDNTIQDVAKEYMPNAWAKLPQDVRDDIVITAGDECHEFLEGFLKDLQEHVEDVIDVKQFTVAECVANKHLLIKIFQECGEQEFKFIRQSGFYFGFIFGLGQMVIWFFYPAPWIMPLAGFLVGWVTNYVALKIIFRPINPTMIFGCYNCQGLFLKRQQEVSETFARVIVCEILHVKAIWDAIFEGPLCSNFYAMLRAHTLMFTEKFILEIKPVAIAAMGAEKFALMKESIAQKILDGMHGVIDRSYEYTQDALDMEATIAGKMKLLPPLEFEGVLHPAFEEDEMQLVILGGVLGAIVGVLQLVTVFG